MDVLTLNVIKVFAPATAAFALGIAITPFITDFLYSHQMWKKKSVIAALGGGTTPLSQALHNDEERKTPRMGGIVVWASTLLTTLLFWLAAQIDGPLFEKLNFFSRNQTWLTVFTMLAGAFIGLVDDYFSVSERYDHLAGGLSLKKRLIIVCAVAAIGAWWFFFKLETSVILVPFLGEWNIGWWFIPFFILTMIATYSGGVIDGLDGLSGGVFAAIFSAYGAIAFFQDQINLAAFSFVIVGALLAFLWFNIPPARFFMTETGIMALTMTLAVIAFLTRQVLILPIVAFPLLISSLSSSIQILSKKYRGGKKVFRVAPLHHHLQAIGWPHYKVTMRYWVISVICGIVGTIIALVG